MLQTSDRVTQDILGINIDVLSWRLAIDKITDWALQSESRYVCICNVHSTITAKQRPDFERVVNAADMATPDGMPLAWYMRFKGYRSQQRINGPDLMWKYCRTAAEQGIPIFLYGSTSETLTALVRALHNNFPTLKIAGYDAPPFRELTAEEDKEKIDIINQSGAKVVFVSLGCPKQELWMAKHTGKINAVMLGVGAAFDYHAGIIRRAPLWMQHSGLEWLYRLLSEPRRLWRRYFVTNSLFLCYLLMQPFKIRIMRNKKQLQGVK